MQTIIQHLIIYRITVKQVQIGTHVKLSLIYALPQLRTQNRPLHQVVTGITADIYLKNCYQALKNQNYIKRHMQACKYIHILTKNKNVTTDKHLQSNLQTSVPI